MYEYHCDNCYVSLKAIGDWPAEDCALDIYRAFLPYSSAVALVIDACWRESEIIGKSTVHMPPLRLHVQYGMNMIEANFAIQAAITNKFLRPRADAGYYLVNHKLIAQVTK